MSEAAKDLTAWNEQFGDVDLFSKDERPGQFNFEMKLAYPCRIKRAECKRSKFGDLQIELQFDVQGSDGEGDDVPVVGSSRVWLDLPKQPGDIGKDKELVQKLTQRRYQNLLRVLSAAAPARYSLYAERKGQKNAYKFYDFDGELMDGSDFNERKIETQTACIDFADKLEEGENIEILEGALLYIEKAPNPKNEKYPYTNFYARRPDDVKVFSSEDAAPF